MSGASAALAPSRAPALLALLALAAALALSACSRDGGRPPAEPDEPAADPAIDLVRSALGPFQEAAGRDLPGGGDARLSRARRLVQAGDLPAARGVLEGVLEADRAPGGEEPPWARDEAALILGIVHLEERRAALAAPLLERVLARGPTFRRSHQAFYQYGKALAELGRPAAARAAFEADAELFPESGDAWFQLGLLDVEEGLFEQAREKLEQALARFEAPRDVARAHARLGDVAFEAGDLEEAEGHYLACVERFPHYEVYYKLARVARRRGDESAAAEYERRHEELRPRAVRPPPPAPR